eukprot:SAG11_NODE_6033_length_1405_cov_1.744257_1_plen_104_part_00
MTYLRARNTSVSTSTGMTPFYVEKGRNPIMVVDQLADPRRSGQEPEGGEADQHLARFKNNRRMVHHKLRWSWHANIKNGNSIGTIESRESAGPDLMRTSVWKA